MDSLEHLVRMMNEGKDIDNLISEVADMVVEIGHLDGKAVIREWCNRMYILLCKCNSMFVRTEDECFSRENSPFVFGFLDHLRIRILAGYQVLSEQYDEEINREILGEDNLSDFHEGGEIPRGELITLKHAWRELLTYVDVVLHVN